MTEKYKERILTRRSRAYYVSAGQKLIESKVSHEDEKKLIIKNFKSKIKSWKKDLGVERLEKMKSEKKLDTRENHIKEVNCKTKYPFPVKRIILQMFRTC